MLRAVAAAPALYIPDIPMIRYAFTLIIAIHALLHLLGFLKAFEFARIEQLLIPISKQNGILWLAACLLLLAASAGFALRYPAWWMIAIPAILLSQYLIILSWKDAGYGTIPNILFLLVAVIAAAEWSFIRDFESEKARMYSAPQTAPSVIHQQDIMHLPEPVRKWMMRSGAVGRESAISVYIEQTGSMITEPGGSTMEFTASQYFRNDIPGFVWLADVSMNPLMFLSGRDTYYNGHGRMLIKFFSLFSVVDAAGEQIDQGTMLRYMGESCWFPSFALSPYVTWQQIDSNSARMIFTYKGKSAEGIYTFTEDGDFSSFEAMRYYTRKEGATLERWHISVDKDGYRTFDGLRIPAKLSVTWKLSTGDFTWLHLVITHLRCNPGKGDKNND